MRMIIRILLCSFVFCLCTAPTPKKAAQGPPAKKDKKASFAMSFISRDRAVEIARADAELRYGSKGEDVGSFAVIACEQAKVWRIIFDIKTRPDTTPQTFPNAAYPKYVIDKKTGEIIYRELN